MTLTTSPTDDSHSDRLVALSIYLRTYSVQYLVCRYAGMLHNTGAAGIYNDIVGGYMPSLVLFSQQQQQNAAISPVGHTIHTRNTQGTHKEARPGLLLAKRVTWALRGNSRLHASSYKRPSGGTNQEPDSRCSTVEGPPGQPWKFLKRGRVTIPLPHPPS